MPFLLRWPKRIPSGTVSDEPVISIDAFATILAASGVELPANLIIDSRDILPAVTGALDHPLHEALYWSWINKDSDKGWAVRKGYWKLLTDKGGLELYDLEGDISETHNLASLELAIVEELLASYRRWRKGLVPLIRRQRLALQPCHITDTCLWPLARTESAITRQMESVRISLLTPIEWGRVEFCTACCEHLS